MGNDCTQCGRNLGQEGLEYCPDCDVGPDQRDTAPVWPLVALAIVGSPWYLAAPEHVSADGISLLVLLGFGAGLLLLYFDAKWASEADQLDVATPILVPLVVLLFWVIMIPVYAGYRIITR
jgi:hypothetical protein